jgi:hypothetical protein
MFTLASKHTHRLQVLGIEPLTFTTTNQALTNGLHYQKMSIFVNFFISHATKLQESNWLNIMPKFNG